MALKVPKIVYNAGAGNVTLNFTWPPVEKPGADARVAERTDSITCSGKKQSVWERTDVFKTLTLNFVPMADLANWISFLEFALQGGEFDYYPDSTLSSYTTCTLEDTSWEPKYGFRTMAKFSLKFRQAVGS